MTKLQAVVFDWAGTMIDHGSLAPMGVFVKAFAEFGVEITVDEARGPMGMAKRDHIATLLADPRIAAAWEAAQGAAPDDAAIDRLYEVFVPMNTAVLKDYATLIDGAWTAYVQGPAGLLAVLRDADRHYPLKDPTQSCWALVDANGAVISTGAAPGYFAIRIGRLLGAKTIWVDSIANAEELSMTGKLVQRHADVWLTQWEHLSRPEGPGFAGAVL